MLAARAAELLPASSRMRVVHAGAPLEAVLEREARHETRSNPRYRWLGPLPRAETLRMIASSRALLVTSLSEGGANVVSEAIVNHTPVLSTWIDGSRGLLGDEYPGYFPVGDAPALAQLLARFESEPAFRADLSRACTSLEPLFTASRERAAWDELTRELVPAR